MTDGSRTRMTISEAFAAVPILPVLTFDDPLDALVVCSALREGGIRAVEITLRTASGAAAIERVAAETDLLVGAGTVLTGADVHRVIGAGARFLVSPGFDDEVVQTARDAGIPAVPGVATPTEVQRALRAGLTDVKVFPASSLGGPAYLRHLTAPFPQVRLLPSGGVTFDSLVEYLGIPAVLAVSGSWMVPQSADGRRDAGRIRALAAEAVERARLSR